MTWTEAQQRAIFIAPIISGIISFIASLAIIVMILRSKIKLSKPFRRIIFGMSVYDVIQSSTSSLSSITNPSGTAYGAIGNDATCSARAFFYQVSEADWRKTGLLVGPYCPTSGHFLLLSFSCFTNNDAKLKPSRLRTTDGNNRSSYLYSLALHVLLVYDQI